MLIYLANIHITSAFKVKTIYLAVVKIIFFPEVYFFITNSLHYANAKPF